MTKDIEYIKYKDETLRLVCCDCGLTHDINMDVKKDIIEMEFRRNHRSTGQTRRWNKND